MAPNSSFKEPHAMKTVMTFYGLLRRRSGVNSWKAPRDLLRRGSHVEAALQKAESLGGTRRMGPEKNPGADLVVAHFTDPEGHLIGLAGPS
jgi:predicted enzyme related to lactoylglutathione lyase